MSAGIDIPQLDPVAPAVPPLRHVKLDRLVNMAVERTREGMRARHQQLHVEAMAAPIVVCGDRDTLAEALARLLDTASNAAGEGGVVTLSVSQIGLNATLKVGVCRQMAGASDSDTDCDWTAVERLIEAHGGTVSARTHAEGGAEYALLLPVLQQDEAPVTRRASLIAGPEAPVCRVLVVDDSADAADSIACLLSIRGHEVRVAYDGPSAYAKLLEWEPDVVLLDVQLPGMDGHEIVDAVRARMHEGRTPPQFIALSGYGPCARGKASFDLYLTKPVDPSILMKAMERCARKSAAQVRA
ncbi:MAG TPA: response regulator [Burkholderiales bacterium]|nr:response regulator [Burkholderiales bacterium]